MCGIAGTLVFDGSGWVIPDGYLEALGDAMVHRGPDHGGTWRSADRRVGLACRRLSVLDPGAHANQPFGEDQLVLVFNGEIYNHAELRVRLDREARPRWKTDHSDTEVLLEAYRHWGIGCVEELRGMFALAVWDAAERTLWVARDRVGIKPLFYGVHHGRFVFGSTTAALWRDPDARRELDPTALAPYLSFAATPAPHTLLADVRKLPPASVLRVSGDGRMETHRYWTPRRRVIDAGDAPREVERLLGRAVAERVRADVPVGVFVSAGIDSGLVASYATREGAAPMPAFTVGYDRSYRSYGDEIPDATQTARRFGMRHEARRLDLRNAMALWPDAVVHQSEPLGDPVCIANLAVARACREEGVVVALSGEGADELFFGYPRWLKALWLERLDRLPVPRGWKQGLGAALDSAGFVHHPYREALRRSVEGTPLFWSGIVGLDRVRTAALVDPQRAPADPELARRWVREESAVFAELGHRSPAAWFTYADLRLRLPELLLARLDTMGMAASVEVRVPFLDHELVELALSLPDSLRHRQGRSTKPVLRGVARRTIGAHAARRPKQGLAVPLPEWLEQGLRSQVSATLERFAAATGWLRLPALRTCLARGTPDEIWPLFALAAWWEAHVNGRSGG